MTALTDNQRRVERAREAALRLLDRSRKTRRDLEQRLREKQHPEAAIAAALDRLAAVGLVDDVEYARAYARGKLARRPVALRLVRQELLRRGVAEADVEAGLARLAADSLAGPDLTVDAEGERARARRALAPLLRRHRGLEPRERRARCAAALARRGFSYTVIEDVLPRDGGDAAD